MGKTRSVAEGLIGPKGESDLEDGEERSTCCASDRFDLRVSTGCCDDHMINAGPSPSPAAGQKMCMEEFQEGGTEGLIAASLVCWIGIVTSAPLLSYMS